MDKKVDLNSRYTTNKINLNKNKSISLTINLNNKPQGNFKLRTPKIRRNPSNIKYKKRVEEETQIEGRLHQAPEELVEFDDEIEEEFDDEIEEDNPEEETNESSAKDKLKEQLEKRKNRQAQNNTPAKNQPGQNHNTAGNEGNTVSNGGTPPATTPGNAGGTAVGGGTAGGTAAGGGTAGGTAAGGGTAVGEGIVAVLPYIGVALLIILVIVVIIAVIIVLVSRAKYNSSGYYAYGQTCTTVTIENTGCDANGNNCTNVYDGNVDVETYVAGVVAANDIGNVGNLDYYKVAAIAARTYFYDQVDDECTVQGNSSFQPYMDVEDSPNASLIKQAVEETDKFVIIEDDNLVTPSYDYGYIERADATNYYIGYGYNSLSTSLTQTIPRTWVEANSLTSQLSASTKDYDVSLIGVMYLTTTQGYTYESAINYYYGNTVQIVENNMIMGGVEGFINPTRYIHCTSAFGPRIHPVSGANNNHTGLDIAISSGEPIYAAKDGTVTKVVSHVTAINNCTYGYGNYVLIEHGDGMATLYAHMKYGSIPSDITVGMEISQGEEIGQVGSTGCSTGNHLHYEVRQNGQYVDPADYLDLTEATGACR